MSDLKTSQPPEHKYLLDTSLGYGSEVKNSFSQSIKLLLKITNCPTEFKTICEKMNLSTEGNKNQLITRILE